VERLGWEDGQAVNKLEDAILACLRERDMYGLELIEEIPKRTNGDVKPHQGTLYTALRDLEAEGLLSSYEDGIAHPERGGRPRRYWHLEGGGRREPETGWNPFGGLAPA
jgi:PadR family transcriptional regulator PadR